MSGLEHGLVPFAFPRIIFCRHIQVGGGEILIRGIMIFG